MKREGERKERIHMRERWDRRREGGRRVGKREGRRKREREGGNLNQDSRKCHKIILKKNLKVLVRTQYKEFLQYSPEMKT